MKKLALSLLILIPSLTLAAPPGVTDTGLHYNNIDVQYVNVDFDGLDADGFALSGSYLFSESLFLIGAVSRIESDRFEDSPDGINNYYDTFKLTEITAGLGIRAPISRNVDVFGSAAVVHAEMEGTGEIYWLDESDTGFALQAGVRALVAPAIELEGSVTYLDVYDDTTTRLAVSGAFYFTPRLAATASIGTDDDSDRFGVGLRFSF